MSRSIVLVGLVGLLAPVFASSESGMELVAGRLRADALVASSIHWWQVEQSGLTNRGVTIDRILAPVGLTGLVSPIATLRASCDIGALEPQDLCVDLRWSSGFGVRAGQFKLPVGVDQMTDPEYAKLVYGSLLATYARPADVRDVGISGAWTGSRAGAVMAVINGNGPNAADDNDRKDLCGRVVVKPWAGSDVEIAARAYYGWPDAAKAAWRTAAVEVIAKKGRLSLQAELQNHMSADLHNNAGYLQFSYCAGTFEPVCRLDVVLPGNERSEFMATGGVNFRPLGDHLKLMLDGLYRCDLQAGIGVTIFTMRVQAAL